jgi:hypothetical protein
MSAWSRVPQSAAPRSQDRQAAFAKGSDAVAADPLARDERLGRGLDVMLLHEGFGFVA